MIIAIDGPSASGKGTLARKLAAHFNLPYLDTGALYRAVGLALKLDLGFRRDDGMAADEHIQSKATTIAQTFKNSVPQELLNDPDLRSEEVGMLAGKVSAIPAVRQHLLEMQKQFAAQPGGAVLDGRDIGTVIAPNADVKIFVTASAEKRAQRRLKELQLGGKEATYEAVLKDMQERDARDAARPIAPTKPADDAALLDTDDQDADAAFAAALAIVREKTGRF